MDTVKILKFGHILSGVLLCIAILTNLRIAEFFGHFDSRCIIQYSCKTINFLILVLIYFLREDYILSRLSLQTLIQWVFLSLSVNFLSTRFFNRLATVPTELSFGNPILF